MEAAIDTVTVGGRPVDILRLDTIHPEYGGNKLFKLKYNVKAAILAKARAVVSSGGAHSNHLAALATYCKPLGLPVIALVHGPEVTTPTIEQCVANGAIIRFVPGRFGEPLSPALAESLHEQYGDLFEIPAGGANRAGFEGCREILLKHTQYDYVFCACGTGTTFAGLVAAAPGATGIVGVSPLKGDNTLPEQVMTNLRQWTGADFEIAGNEWQEKEGVSHAIINSFAGAGFGKFDEQSLNIARHFKAAHGIELDYVYTAKLFLGLAEIIASGRLGSSARILAIHSGGQQGNAAFEQRYHRSIKAAESRVFMPGSYV